LKEEEKEKKKTKTKEGKSNKKKERVTVRAADFLPHVTAVQLLLEVENRVTWRTVSSFVELEQLLVLI